MITREQAIEYARLINTSSVSFDVVVAFGNAIRIATDVRFENPPRTEYPQQLGKHPDRGFCVFGPHRIAYLHEPITFFGGYSYIRRRWAATGHQWRVLLNDQDVTNNQVHCISSPRYDYDFTYHPAPQPAYFDVVFLQPGIYDVELTIDTRVPVSSRRQVIVIDRRAGMPYDVSSLSISGGVDAGGWTMEAKLHGDLSVLANIDAVEGYVPVVVRVDFYAHNGSDRVRLRASPDYHPSRPHEPPEIVFCGYIDAQSISYSFDRHEASISCRTADMILEQMQTHVVGFFRHVNNGIGVTFNDMTFGDVVGYMLLERSNFADHHDVLMFYSAMWVPGGQWYSVSWENVSQAYGAYVTDNRQTANMEYRDWTFNQGQYWSNIRDGARNEFCFAFFTQRNGLWIIPDRNYWYPQAFFDHSQVNTWNGSTYEGSRYTRFDLNLVHATVRLPIFDIPMATIAGSRSPGYSDFDGLYEAFPFYPVHIPESVSVSVRTGLPAYYKITASLSNWNEEWGADYPQHATDPQHGRWLLAGPWTLDSGRYWSDQVRDQAWANLWRFAQRGYHSIRARTTAQAKFSAHVFLRLCDMVVLVHPAIDGRFSGNAFHVMNNPGSQWYEVQSISYSVDGERRIWETTYQLREVTIFRAIREDVPIPPLPDSPSRGDGQ